MSLEQINKFADAFVKLAFVDKSVEAKLTPIIKGMTALAKKLVAAQEDMTSVSPDAKKWAELRAAYRKIMDAYARTVGMLVDVRPNDPRVVYWKSLKKRLKQLEIDRQGGGKGRTYKEQAETYGANRPLVMFLERFQNQSGGDKGLFQRMSTEVAKHRIPNKSMVVTLEVYPTTTGRPYPNFKVSGGNPKLQEWVKKTIIASGIQRALYNAFVSKKLPIPKQVFTYEIVRLP